MATEENDEFQQSAKKQKLQSPLTPEACGSLNITKGKGQYLYDQNGEQYLDTAGNGVHLGHAHPRVVEAGSKQMALLCTNTRFLNDCMVLYAKHLCSTLPSHLTQCFFTNTGSEANDLAVQIAQRVAGGTHVIALEGAYHGLLASLRALNSNQVVERDGLYDVSKAPLPVSGSQEHQPNPVEEIVKQQQLQGKKVAGFIHESLPYAAGKGFCSASFLQQAYNAIHSCGGLCIADEVPYGPGCIGSHMYAFQKYGLTPDIVTMGKLVGNGHPVAVVVTTKEIADKFGSCGVEYFNTFGGNPVSMAVANEVLSVVIDEGLQHHSAEVGGHLVESLKGLMKTHQSIGAVHGFGLYIVIEFVQDRLTCEPDTELAEDVKSIMLEAHRIIVTTHPVYGNVLKLRPPLCITKEDSQYIVDSLDSVLTELSS